MEETQSDTGSRWGDRKLQNGAAIRALREKDGWTQTAFAAEVGITQAGLSRIESEACGISLPLLNRIARALRVPIAAIMRDCDGSAWEAETNGAAA